MGLRDDLHRLIDRLAGRRVLVVGDLTLDEFMTGLAERISREGPVLILRHEHTRQVPGGAANAAYNLARLGAQVAVAGVTGQDSQAAALKTLLAEAGIDVSGLVTDAERPTVTKTRIAAHSRQSVTQQVVRIDRKSDRPLPPPLARQLAERIGELAGSCAAVVCSDYSEGVFSDKTIAASLLHPCVVVDTHLHPERYHGATVFTPNLPEAETAVGYPIQDAGTLLRAGQELLIRTGARHMLITRGEEGMSLFSAGEAEARHIPAFNRTQVFDVTGAGDTVVAAFTLALVSGGSAYQATILGNLAASIVVRRLGTATTHPDELHAHLEELEWTSGF
ncbi:bifunctional heptose 7-phosphate kinase/heptose 1-phosphate adenyltransferase [Gloeobacter violaceus]|uniref:Glr2641 protein n=1 Tax=Gloeobacter violaceus (strain ATCC 29082 / PCC 7421) TaxID=251221 RepID=Q7NH96_GLOVI|nr:PfkB family carbohydrate kinase [Gloeobacter violaceus]BAC90582.1 glr2641 [Gloeobacter violaceus PCC 7421]